MTFFRLAHYSPVYSKQTRKQKNYKMFNSCAYLSQERSTPTAAVSKNKCWLFSSLSTGEILSDSEFRYLQYYRVNDTNPEFFISLFFSVTESSSCPQRKIRSPEWCSKLESWQGPPHTNKVKQNETVSILKVSMYIKLIQPREFFYLVCVGFKKWSMKISLLWLLFIHENYIMHL